MSTLKERIEKRAAVPDVSPDDLDHYHCCDGLVAICGYRADPDDPWIPWTDDPEANDCPACVAAHQISPDSCGMCSG